MGHPPGCARRNDRSTPGTPHGGDLNGLLLLRGSRQKLAELRRSDDFERFSLQLGTALDRYGVVPGVTLEGLKKVRERNPQLFG